MIVVPRTVKQPGPISPIRIDVMDGEGKYLAFDLEPGLCLRDALIGPLTAAGILSGTVRIEHLYVKALHYVRPSLPEDDQHAAFYSAPFEIAHTVHIKFACVTIGRKDGAPFVHCHAVWDDDDGTERGGHLFNEKVFVERPVRVEAWGLPDVAMQADYDEETNFTLFHPVRDAVPAAAQAASSKRCVVGRIRPNVDLVRGIEQACRTHGLKNARIRGSVGSIIGVKFEDSDSTVDDIATEIMVVNGSVSGGTSDDPVTTLDIALIDTQGRILRGRVQRDVNPVLICFELVLEEVDQTLPTVQH